MSGLTDMFREFWAIIMAGILGLVWLVRLESRSIANEREIKRMGEQRKEDLDNAEKSRDDVQKMLTEIRQDIKKLLGRHQS
jgi:hypothetical protein